MTIKKHLILFIALIFISIPVLLVYPEGIIVKIINSALFVAGASLGWRFGKWLEEMRQGRN